MEKYFGLYDLILMVAGSVMIGIKFGWLAGVGAGFIALSLKHK